MVAWRSLAPRFDDPGVEAVFRRETALETVPIVRAGFIVGIPLWILVAVLLPYAATIDAGLLLGVAGAMVAVDVVSYWLVRGEPSLARLEAIGIAGTISNALAVMVLTLGSPVNDRYTLPGLMLSALYAVAVFRIRLPVALIPATAIVVAFAFSVAPRWQPGQMVFDTFLLVSMLVVGFIGVAVLDRSNRERFVQRRTIEAQREEVARERAKSDALLRAILPASVAEQLRERHEAVAERHEATTLLFADLVGFTAMAERLGPQRTAALLNDLVSRWDDLAVEAGAEKIKTIGDAYFAAAGVPEADADHARRIVELGLAMIGATAEAGRAAGEPLAIRVGVHSGPVVAGVIGRTKFSYDLWGDTVNVASRLESTGIPGEIQASGATVALLDGAFEIVARGEVELKGKGPTPTFLVRRRVGERGASPGPAAQPSAIEPAPMPATEPTRAPESPPAPPPAQPSAIELAPSPAPEPALKRAEAATSEPALKPAQGPAADPGQPPATGPATEPAPTVWQPGLKPAPALTKEPDPPGRQTGLEPNPAPAKEPAPPAGVRTIGA